MIFVLKESNQQNAMTVNILIVLLTMVFMGSNPGGKPASEASSDREIHRDFDDILELGIEAFYQADWDEAQAVFEELRNRDASDLRPWFFEAMVPFWKYFFAGQDSEMAREFLDWSGKAVEVGDRRLSNVPGDTTAILMMGGLHGYRGLVAASEREFRTAMRSGAAGYSFTRKLMQMSSENPDALIGQGVYHYMVGTIPDGARWLTNMAGLRGDKLTGFSKLEEAAERNSHTRTDARMILTYLYHQEEKYEDALRVSSLLVDDWPENEIFRYYYAISLEKTGRNDEAADQFRIVEASEHADLDKLRKESRERRDTLISE